MFFTIISSKEEILSLLVRDSILSLVPQVEGLLVDELTPLNLSCTSLESPSTLTVVLLLLLLHLSHLCLILALQEVVIEELIHFSLGNAIVVQFVV